MTEKTPDPLVESIFRNTDATVVSDPAPIREAAHAPVFDEASGLPVPIHLERDFVDIVFDGPPSHESGRFVEVEDDHGHSISIGTWIRPVDPDAFWRLRIPMDRATLTAWQVGWKAACDWLRPKGAIGRALSLEMRTRLPEDVPKTFTLDEFMTALDFWGGDSLVTKNHVRDLREHLEQSLGLRDG